MSGADWRQQEQLEEQRWHEENVPAIPQSGVGVAPATTRQEFPQRQDKSSESAD